MESNLLSIQHMDFGLEQFRIKSARCNLYKDEEGIWEFVVKVSCGEATIRSKELEAIISAKPNFEATAIIPENNISLIPGKILTQKEGYNYDRGENLSNIYYFDHNSIEELKIELTEITEEWIDAKVSGTAVINGSNGTKPDAKISLRCRFERDTELKRGIT